MAIEMKIQPGNVVYAYWDGALRPLAVDGVEEKSISIVMETGQSQKLRRDRVVHLSSKRLPLDSPGGGEAAAQLKGYFEEVQNLASDIHLEELWELLLGQEERISLEGLAELCFAEESPSRVDAMFLALKDCPVYFKTRPDGLEPLPAATVESLLVQRKKEEEKAHLEKTVFADLKERIATSTPLGEPVEGKTREVIEALRKLALHGEDHPGYKESVALVGKLMPGNPLQPDLSAFDALVRLGVWGADENLDIYRNEVRTEFPEEVLANGEELAEQSVNQEAGRKELFALSFLAIDDAGTLDVDDALAVERLEDGTCRIWVVISDVCSAVPVDSPVNDEARKRGSSLYLPYRKIPMIPEGLSNRTLSLCEGEQRLVMAFSFVVSHEGELSAVTVEEAVATVEKQLTYDEVDAILAAEEPSPYADDLAVLYSVAELIRDAREEGGGVMLRQPEWKVRVEEDGEIEVERIDPYSAARQLVAELMIGTCALVGDFLAEREIPALFRGQARASEVVEFDDCDAADPYTMYSVLRHMKRAELSVTPKHHYSLGVEAYAQVTSPIRRYQDLLIHRQLKRFLVGETLLTEEELLLEIAEVESVGALFRRMERNARRYWVFRFLEMHPGKIVEAVLLRPLGRRWLANLPEYGMGIPITLPKAAQPGDAFKMRVKKVDPRRDQLVLEI